LLAEVAVYSGDLEEALDAVRRAKLLHPHYPSSFDWIEGQILFHLGRFDDAQPFLEAAAAGDAQFYRGLIALAANYGQQRKFEAAKAVMQKAFARKPELVLKDELASTPYQIEERRRRIAEGLRMAGILE